MSSPHTLNIEWMQYTLHCMQSIVCMFIRVYREGFVKIYFKKSQNMIFSALKFLMMSKYTLVRYRLFIYLFISFCYL